MLRQEEVIVANRSALLIDTYRNPAKLPPKCLTEHKRENRHSAYCILFTKYNKDELKTLANKKEENTYHVTVNNLAMYHIQRYPAKS